MIKARAFVGVAVLCTLALSAFTAAGASAKGTTGFTCVKDSGGDVVGAHCLSSGGGEKYKHVEIEPGKQTTIAATNENTAEGTTAAKVTSIKSTVAGVATEIQCTSASGTGTFENKTTGEEMYLHSLGQLNFTGCTITLPSGKGCKLKSEAVTTNQLTSTSAGQGDAVTISPAEGSVFAEFTIEGCSNPSMNISCAITGNVKAFGPGATLTTTDAETTSTLKLVGQKAGLESSLTIKAHAKEGETTNPISVTTVP
ncbi:MAG TPA: hypothetical protein VFJ57_13040 [Solirubrobacterales bacterium]|nr:hypothetical protein [Solirubrobacterales bacterium]